MHSEFLAGSQFLADLDHIAECFDKTTKLRFRNSAEDQYTRFGGPRDDDPECNIQFGQLKLIGTDVALFFDPSIDCVVQAVLSQQRTALKPIFVEQFHTFATIVILNFNFSMSCSLVDLPQATGYSTKSAWV